MADTRHKRQVFIIYAGRDIEFIDPKGYEKILKARGEEVKVHQEQYNNMLYLYREPHAAVHDEERKKLDDRGYQEGVFRFASDEDWFIELPKNRKKDAMYALDVCKKLSATAYLDTRNGLSFDEVPDEDEKVLPAKK